MSLQSYFDRLENTLRSRRDIALERFEIRRKPESAILTARARFFDSSLLGIVELSAPHDIWSVEKVHYSYHLSLEPHWVKAKR